RQRDGGRARRDGRAAGDDQRRRRLPRHPTHAEDVPTLAMPVSAILTAYLVAALLFILSLRGLSTQASAQRGNTLGVIGMALAVALTAGALVFPPTGVAGLADP